MILPEGTLLHGGTYKIVEMLGQGSFGITYLANHTALEKKVAIKEFFMKELNSRGADGSITGMSDGSLSYNYGQKFKKEALNLSRLEHPNIVRVTDSFEENGTFYYVMDYIEGQNLNDYLKNKTISESEAVAIIKEVANALEYMHDEKHMLHLDLKPGNIMRRKGDGHIFLIDFGLSKHYDGNGAPETSTTIGLGTAGYAPIEQSNQAKNGEFRPTIDVYALGATLYKLLTGETPPVASELVSDDELLKDSLIKHHVSKELIAVVEAAMRPNVRKRTQTMRAFIDTLPSSVSKTSSNSSQTDTVSEETEYINNGNTSEETEYIGSSTKRQSNIGERNDSSASAETYSPVKDTNDSSNGNVVIWAIGVIICLFILFVWGKSCQAQKEAEERTKIENAINNANDFYIDENNNVYCVVNGANQYIDFYGIPNGTRKLHYASNDSQGRKMFYGEFYNGARVQGTLVWNNGDTYKGSFSSGEMYKGTYKVYGDGSYFTGYFNGNQPYNGKWYDKNGKYLQTVSYGN